MGPLYFTGETSLKNFGQNKLKQPADIPNKKRAIIIAKKLLLIKHSKLPTSKIAFVSKMQFLLPMIITGPITRAPNADPNNEKVVKIEDLKTISLFILGSSMFSNSGKLTAKKLFSHTFQEVIEYPKIIIPMETVPIYPAR